ncbi:hypothetical protein [Nodularia sp. UHCC 0506]|uniref:hypothetical protein n=1 Tax=Nodularia sp. UHCC 0506 TaxID=3110243 RepID=UPI002B2141C3|nr:hypothetical protein [Nodularia sp. UHCC 0506]MEA5514095.1 hypothetical protein [Nodularia sp. UHCC 0506]
MAAFEGAADPSKAIESGYYVHAPGKLLVDHISGRIALRPSSSHLLIGGIGSGKTTQLLVACEQINEIEDIHAIYVDVSLYTDISQISSGVLTAIAGLKLSEIMADSENETVKKYINLIFNLAFGYSEEHDIDLTISNLALALNTKSWNRRHKGIIPNTSDKYGVKAELLEAVTEIRKAASTKYGHIVLLFDGLDRLDDAKTFMQIVSSDAKAISSAGIGLVIVGPIIALYSEYRDTVDNRLDYFYHQPFFDINNDQTAYNFFEKIIQTRSSEDFIEKSAIEALIKLSGGVLRDFISLSQASIEETYLSNQNKVEVRHVINAVTSFSRNQLLGISEDELKIVRQTMNTEIFIPRTDEDLRLLVRRIILEYRYPKIRHTVHPALEPFIEKITE